MLLHKRKRAMKVKRILFKVNLDIGLKTLDVIYNDDLNHWKES